MIQALSHTFRRRLQCGLARRQGFYLDVLRWTGGGSLEKKVYLSLIREGDTVFDIGANLGHFTLLFSDLVGRRGEVHAFEPVPPTFAQLRHAVETDQRYDNVFLNQAACSAQEGAVAIQMPGDDCGQASLQSHQEGSWRTSRSITRFETMAVRLDNYARGGSPGRMDFVKCDVEGAELPALQGMEDRLRQCQPLLFLEVFAKWTESFGYRPTDLVDFLQAVGYDRFYSANSHLTRLADVRGAVATEAGEASTNLLCAVGGWHEDRLAGLAKL